METKQSLTRAAQEYQAKIDAEMEKENHDATLIDLWTVRRDALLYRAVNAPDERDEMFGGE